MSLSIRNTVVQGSDLVAGGFFNNLDMAGFKVLRGVAPFAALGAAGGIAVGRNGSQIVLEAGDVVIQVGARAPTTLTGATSWTIGRAVAATPTTQATALSAALVLASVNVGIAQAAASLVNVAGEVYIMVTQVGALTNASATSLIVSLLILNLNNSVSLA